MSVDPDDNEGIALTVWWFLCAAVALAKLAFQ